MVLVKLMPPFASTQKLERERENCNSRTFQVQRGVGDGAGEVDAALLLLTEADGGRLLVEPDAEALQLLLNQLLVRHRLQAVQHDKDEVARARCADDLREATRGTAHAPSKHCQQLLRLAAAALRVMPNPHRICRQMFCHLLTCQDHRIWVYRHTYLAPTALAIPQLLFGMKFSADLNLPGNAHLPPAALAVLGALNNAGQVQQLDLGAFVPDHSRDARQRRELVACVRMCELGRKPELLLALMVGCAQDACVGHCTNAKAAILVVLGRVEIQWECVCRTAMSRRAALTCDLAEGARQLVQQRGLADGGEACKGQQATLCQASRRQYTAASTPPSSSMYCGR